jgi:hypothetical protein
MREKQARKERQPRMANAIQETTAQEGASKDIRVEENAA